MAATARLGQVRPEVPPGPRQRAPEEHEGDAILRHLVDFIDAFMWQADPATLEITFITSSVRLMLGHPLSAWLGAPDRWSALLHPADRPRVIECLRATATDGEDREVESRATAVDGRSLELHHAVRLVVSSSGARELWGITTDVTGDKRAAETLRETQERYRALSAQAAEFRRQALEDALTRLPNRVLLDDRLRTTLRAAERSGEPVAVLLMDLDRFKQINDIRGHQVGDAVLRQVALRFRICLRAQDTPARIGGDEFAAVLPNTDQAGAVRVADRIVRTLEPPILVDDEECRIGASVGIALFPAQGADADELLACADVAMYRAKSSGGGYALASAGENMPVRHSGRRHGHRLRRIFLGATVGFAILAGALSPVAHHRTSSRDSAYRLEAATTALQGASDDQVVDVVAGAERTLAAISWDDVAGPEVIAALDRLQRTLHDLKSLVPDGLGDRVQRLIATIQRAELVARISGGSRPGPLTTMLPKVQPKRTTTRPSPRASATVAPLSAPSELKPPLP